MKKLMSFFLLIITFFSIFMFSSCSNKEYVDVEVSVERIEIKTDTNDRCKILFYLPEDYPYDVTELENIKIKFSHSKDDSPFVFTKTKSGKVLEDAKGIKEKQYFYVKLINSPMYDDDNYVRIKWIKAQVDTSKIEIDNDTIAPEKDKSPVTIGQIILIGLLVNGIGFGVSMFGGAVLDDRKGQILFGAGFILPVVFTIFAYISFGVWHGIILTIYNIVQIVGIFMIQSRR